MMHQVKANAVKTLVFVTGKFYYDLLERREKLKRDDVALVRIEQLFPLPEKLSDWPFQNIAMQRYCLGTGRTKKYGSLWSHANAFGRGKNI